MTVIPLQIIPQLHRVIASDWESLCFSLNIMPRAVKNISTGQSKVDLSRDFLTYIRSQAVTLEQLKTAIEKVCSKIVQNEALSIIGGNSEVKSIGKIISFEKAMEEKKESEVHKYRLNIGNFLLPGFDKDVMKTILKDHSFDFLFEKRAIKYLMKILKLEDKEDFLNINNTMIFILYFLQQSKDAHLYIKTQISLDDLKLAYRNIITDNFPKPTDEMVRQIMVTYCDLIIQRLFENGKISETDFCLWRTHPAKVIIMQSKMMEIVKSDMVQAIEYLKGCDIILPFVDFQKSYLEEREEKVTIIPKSTSNELETFLKQALQLDDVSEYFQALIKEEVNTLEEFKDILNSEDCNLFLTRIPNMTIGKIRKIKNAMK